MKRSYCFQRRRLFSCWKVSLKNNLFLCEIIIWPCGAIIRSGATENKSTSPDQSASIIRHAIHLHTAPVDEIATLRVIWFLARTALCSAVMPSRERKSKWAPPFFSTVNISTMLSRWAASVKGVSEKHRKDMNNEFTVLWDSESIHLPQYTVS